MENIKITGLTKKYDNKIALDNVSFDIPIGSTCLIVGPNGSGKTTLLNILLGILKKNQGSITIPDGHSISCAFQEPGLYNNLTLMENLKFFSALHGNKNKNMIEYLIDNLNLFQWKKTYASDLSTGNTKKLELALAILSKPDILILDEPLSTLDINSHISVIRLLEDMKSKGITLIISSHEIDIFNFLIDNFIILDKGKVIYNNDLPEMDTEKLVMELRYIDEKQNKNITIQDRFDLLDKLGSIDIEQCSEIVIKRFCYEHMYKICLNK